MIACVDEAVYGVLLLDLLLRVQMNANPRNQNQSYGTCTNVCHSTRYSVHVQYGIMCNMVYIPVCGEDTQFTQ